MVTFGCTPWLPVLRAGPVVILLHGFPQFWYGWYNQIAPLADAGFRVIAPDQRGYNTSSKPLGIPAYKVSQLTSGVIAIVDQLGKHRVHMVGHDWERRYVERCHPASGSGDSSCHSQCAAHPTVLQRNIRTNPSQWLKS
jgi:epoxide hydrolase 4